MVRYLEAARLLRALQRPDPEGLLFDDLNQGWEIAISARGERVYLAEGDGEQSKPCNLCCTDRARLAQLAAATLARTRQQLTLLVRATSQNPWQFGSWRPSALLLHQVEGYRWPGYFPGLLTRAPGQAARLQLLPAASR